jgi:hypothetical protein
MQHPNDIEIFRFFFFAKLKILKNVFVLNKNFVYFEFINYRESASARRTQEGAGNFEKKAIPLCKSL